MAFKQCCDCVNYESNNSNYNNTLADQQAVIALLQHPPPHHCIFIVVCADSWHFSGVLIMRIVWRQLEKTTRFECAALTSVIDLPFFPSMLFPILPSSPIIVFYSSSLFSFNISIHPSLNFSFHLLKLMFFFFLSNHCIPA